MYAAVKSLAKRKSRAKTEKKMATTKSLYAMLSPSTRLGITPGGGGDAATKSPSGELILSESTGRNGPRRVCFRVLTLIARRSGGEQPV